MTIILDLAAIPDFVSGAMEHWGLVTFREATLLYSPKTHSSAIKQNIARVVSHELAHSWFGNLGMCLSISYLDLDLKLFSDFSHNGLVE